MRQTFSGLAKTLTALVVVVVVAFLCLTEFSSGAPPIPAPILLPALPTAPVHQDLLTHSPGSLPLHLFALALSLPLSLALVDETRFVNPRLHTRAFVCKNGTSLLARPGGNHVPRICYSPRALSPSLSLLHGLLGRLNPVFCPTSSSSSSSSHF